MAHSTSHPELTFFNKLAGKLEIELTEPPEKIGDLENVRATPEAQITSLKLVPEVWLKETSDFRDLTPDELQSIAFRDPTINLRSEDGQPITHHAPNGAFFTVKELLDAVSETERQSRGQSEWFGGVDVHHCYFEGIVEVEPDVWEIRWGS